MPINLADDPAYQHELAELDELISDYQETRKNGDPVETLLMLGMLIGQLAVIYKLSPPGGLVDVPQLFQREGE